MALGGWPPAALRWRGGEIWVKQQLYPTSDAGESSARERRLGQRWAGAFRDEQTL